MRSLSLRGDSLRVCQRLQESDQVFDLGLVELGVKTHRVAQRREAAVVHVRRGARHVAQSRDAEAHAAVGDPAAGELRAGMASAAVALADEDPQAALRREPIARGRGILAALQRVAEVVERRAARDEGLLKGGEGFADIDKDFFVRGSGSKNRRSPSSIAAGLPETRLPGSARSGGGQGPCRRIFRISSGLNADAGAIAVSASAARTSVMRTFMERSVKCRFNPEERK